MRMIICMIVSFFIAVHFAAFAADNSYKLGVRAIMGKKAAYDRWGLAVEEISNKSGLKIELVPIVSFAEMELMFEKGGLDMVLTQPLESMKLQTMYKARNILTLMNLQDGHYLKSFSSVIFTQAGRSDLAGLRDLKGRKVAGVNPQGLGGYLMGVMEMKKSAGLDESDYSSVFTGTQDKTVELVLKGGADAGIVRTGVIESMVRKKILTWSDIKILGRRIDGFPLPHSTMTVPEWSLLVSKDFPAEKAQHVLTSVLTSSDCRTYLSRVRWTLPVSDKSLLELMRYL